MCTSILEKLTCHPVAFILLSLGACIHAQAVQLTWEGGVTGTGGADLAEAQRTAVSVLLDNGNFVHPLALADDDPDNHVIACITETSPSVSVSVAAGFFHDPGDDANPETGISVESKMSEQNFWR